MTDYPSVWYEILVTVT